LQIHHNPDGATDVAFDSPDCVKALPMILVASMAEIQPKHVDAGIEQRSDHCRRRAGRSKRRDDFRVP
jgi:hypothetical protein